MGSFDEILGLEDQIAHLEEEVSETEKTLEIVKTKLQRAEDKLQKNKLLVAATRANIAFLKSKDAPVVILSEYLEAVLSLHDAIFIQNELMVSVAKIQLQVGDNQRMLLLLKERISFAEHALSKYGQVVEFRRPNDTQRNPEQAS